jgi:hypothetical protein
MHLRALFQYLARPFRLCLSPHVLLSQSQVAGERLCSCDRNTKLLLSLGSDVWHWLSMVSFHVWHCLGPKEHSHCLKITKQRLVQWLTPEIPARQETETGGSQFKASPGQKGQGPTWKTKAERAGDVAQMINYLHGKCKTLSSTPSTTKKQNQKYTWSDSYSLAIRLTTIH